MKTPMLDKYNLHPFGGRCTCYSHPYSKCTTHEAIKAYQKRMDALTIEQRKKVEEEFDYAYPKRSDNEYGNGGR